MNLRSALLIDRYVARPLAFCLNFLVRVVGKLLRIDHSLDRPFRTIAIGKFKGMGSIIQSTPMIQVIREQNPQARIVYVSTRANRALLEKIEWIDEVITIDDQHPFRSFFTNIGALIRLIRLRPGVYFDLEIYSDFSTLFTLFTLSVNRVGFYLRASSFRMGIYTHMMFYNPRIPISKAYLQMARLLGHAVQEPGLYPLSSEEGSKYERPYIVVNPNASDLRLERRWSKAHFAKLIRSMLDEYPEHDILLVGSKSERPYTASVRDAVDDPRVRNTAGETSLDGLVGIIEEADLMVTNDTGPMHIAMCVNIPVICLFGPCSPDQYVISERAHVIYKQVYCSPCVHEFIEPPCKGDNVCMKLITPEEVLEKVREVMRDPDTPSSRQISPLVLEQDRKVLGIVKR